MFFTKALTAAGLLASVASAVPVVEKRAAGSKLVVYWGAEDDSTTLANVCADPSYDIVNLAFLNEFFAGGGYPSLSLGNLGGPSAAQRAAGATNLQDGTSLISSIQACQAAGKLVILSMGGATDYSKVTLASDAQGQQLADTVWNLFLGGTKNPSLRPFGSVKLDGVDLDNETGNPTGYLAMTQRFRSNFAQDTSKRYYLTAAPQCPFPDASEPLNVCKLLDYVWVQFYNNGGCNIGQSGFLNAVKSWSSGIGSATLFIGALASGADGDQGYVSASSLVSNYKNVAALNLPNVGGVMLWEAQLAVKNGNFQKTVKAGIAGGSTPPPPSTTTTRPATKTTTPVSQPTCAWQGHCVGASCSTDDDCSDVLTCKNGKCSN